MDEVLAQVCKTNEKLGKSRCVTEEYGMQLALVAQARGKYRLAVLDVTTGDITAPTFAQPPLISSQETALTLRVSVSEPATLHWAITYEDISAEYRYQLLGFKSSLLSAEQVLAASDQPDPGAMRLSFHSVEQC
jgi:hypothetical protein